MEPYGVADTQPPISKGSLYCNGLVNPTDANCGTNDTIYCFPNGGMVIVFCIEE